MVKFSLFLSSFFIFCNRVVIDFGALSEDPEASFPGTPSKTRHLSHWPEWCHMPISGPVTVARGHDYYRWLGHESQVPCLVPKACAERYESRIKMRAIPSEVMGMVGR